MAWKIKRQLKQEPPSNLITTVVNLITPGIQLNHNDKTTYLKH